VLGHGLSHERTLNFARYRAGEFPPAKVLLFGREILRSLSRGLVPPPTLKRHLLTIVQRNNFLITVTELEKRIIPHNRENV
jgi:hypothetical protein